MLPKGNPMIKKVKIGGLDYSIIVANKVSEEDPGCEGMILFPKQEIRLQEGMAKDYTNQVLVHEIVHGIFDFLGM